ncbi:hypothetical protein EJ110_NYTH05629 [Nymphaea thermarum]|nr:hypothetical protein EJ110_NYTH05629 [Nymphaea thermarum]
MREKKESGEPSPLSSIEDIQRRLVRPSQDPSFSYPLADARRSDNLKNCESLPITQDSSYVRSEFADRKAEDPKCLEKDAEVYTNSGGQIAELESLDNRIRLLKSGAVDDLNVDDSALLIADFVDEFFKEHQLFLDSESVPCNSADLISGSKPQEDPDKRTTPTIAPNHGSLVSDLKSCQDVKRIESSKAMFGEFSDFTPDSELDPHEEPKLLERLLNSSDSIADLKFEKLLKNSEKTPMILEQVGDPGSCQTVKHSNIGDFVSDTDTLVEEGKPEKPRARRGEEEHARLEDYLHPSLLSAAASKIRKKMKKAIFEWPTEELRTLADSGARAGDGGDTRAGFDSSAFRCFDDEVLKRFHA